MYVHTADFTDAHNSAMDSVKQEIAAAAARWVVEEGLEYGAAKRRAIKQLGLSGRAGLPDNLEVESAVEDYIRVFCADTQADELLALRRLALGWMQRLAHFRPHVGGAVWRGVATRHSDIFLQLFCDDSKEAEIELINLGIRYEASSVTGLHGDPVDALSVHAPCEELGLNVGVHLLIYDFDDLRGALKPDASGRPSRGDTAALQKLLMEPAQ
jgi:hypothetical protein